MVVKHRARAFYSVSYLVLAEFYAKLDGDSEFEILLERAPDEEGRLPVKPFLIRISRRMLHWPEFWSGEHLVCDSTAGNYSPVYCYWFHINTSKTIQSSEISL
jgi:hypothetical protein